MIRVGIIGCGKIAQVRHLPEYAANPHAEVVAYMTRTGPVQRRWPPSTAATYATAILTC